MPDDSKLDLESSADGDQDGLSNRFAGLHVYEPSQEFLDAPPVERPAMAKDDLATYEAEPPSFIGDALFVYETLFQDMCRIRKRIEAIWLCVKVAEYDIAAAAIATNTAIEMVRSMIDEVAPIFEPHGGTYRMLQMIHFYCCLNNGIHHTQLVRRDLDDPFNYESYDIGNFTFYTAHRLLEGVCARMGTLKRNHIILYGPDTAGSFDPKSDRSKKTGYEKYQDDRALLLPHVTDLMTIIQSLNQWPVEDECLRAIREMIDTLKVPVYGAFAAQIFLDISLIFGESIEMPYQTYLSHTQFMATDIADYFDFHSERLYTWTKAFDNDLKTVADNIKWVHDDPLYKVQWSISRNLHIKELGYDRDRLLRTSPMMSGLMLYNFRVDYHTLGFSVANGWGSIMYSQHLLNAVEQAKLVKRHWVDMEVVRTLVGNDSFFVGGELPKTPLDQLKKMAVQLGSSAAIFPSQSRREIAHRKSRAGARSMKTNAVISRMFQNRYGGNGEDVITVDRVYSIMELSNFEKNVDAEGREYYELASNRKKPRESKKLKANKKVRNVAANPSKDVQADQKTGKEGERLPPETLIWKLLNHLQTERMELMFPYLLMHRWCWRFLEDVSEVCEPVLKRLFGRQYDVKQDEFPSVVSFILMAQNGTHDLFPDVEPLNLAADAVLAIFDAGFESFVVKEILGEKLGMKVRVAVEE